MVSKEDFLKNLQAVREQIDAACSSCGRAPDEVSLLPVTKTWPVEVALMAFSAGFPSVGENRVQEALEKIEQTGNAGAWELIGHLQSNKAKFVPGKFERVQSVDSIKLLHRLDAAVAKAESPPLRILLQVNAGDDPAKFGVSIEDADACLDSALSASSLKVEGFMAIAPYAPENPDVALRCFERLRDLRDDLAEKFGVPLPELSMGMTGDLNEAIRAGSTVVRGGAALVGNRPQAHSPT